MPGGHEPLQSGSLPWQGIVVLVVLLVEVVVIGAVVVVASDGIVATTLATNASTNDSTEAASPDSAQPLFDSTLANALPNLFRAFWMQSGSTAPPFETALA